MITCSVVCKRWQILWNPSNNPDHIQESLWRKYVSIPSCFFLPTQHSCENEGSFPGQASYNRQWPNILSWFLLNATGRKRGLLLWATNAAPRHTIAFSVQWTQPNCNSTKLQVIKSRILIYWFFVVFGRGSGGFPSGYFICYTCYYLRINQ